MTTILATDGKLATHRNLASEAAAEYLGVKPQTLAVWRCTGRYEIPYLKVGRKIMYRLSDLDAWLDSRRVVHTGQLAGI